MRIILWLCCLLGGACLLNAQQEEQLSLFSENKLLFNPGYAGNQAGNFIKATTRNQWIGFEGAPQTQMVSFNTALINEKLGLGGHVVRNVIGLSERITVGLDYAYGFPLGNGFLRMGLRTSVRLVSTDYTDARPTQNSSLDEAIPVGMQSKYVPNFGGGIFYDSETFYLGFGIPRILENNLNFGDAEIITSREVKHLFAQGGFKVDLNDEDQFIQTDFILKYVEQAPFDAEASVRYAFNNNFQTGLSYRLGGSTDEGLGEAISAHVGVGVGNKLWLMLSYDYGLSALQNYHNGSVEAHVAYYFQGRKDNNIIPPRTGIDKNELFN